jgi:uncharacterized damage-inducible protein DinB
MKKGAIIKYWDNVRELTLKLLDLFPDDKFSFRPVSEIRSVAEQFEHILSVELYIREGLVSDMWSTVPTLGLGHADKATLRERLNGEHLVTSDVLRALPEDGFNRLYQAKFGPVSGEGLIYLAIDEEIHHRGNLYIYLRLLDIKPPQMVQKYSELFRED